MNTQNPQSSRCQTITTLTQSLENVGKLQHLIMLKKEDLDLFVDVIRAEFKLIQKQQKRAEIGINKSLADTLVGEQ